MDTKMMNCAACGAPIDENGERCPYCGSIIPRGAEKAYMRRLGRMRGDLEKLSGSVESTYGEQMRKRGRRSLRLVLAILVLAAGLAAAAAVWNAAQQRQEEAWLEAEIAFRKEYFPELERLREAGDDDATCDYLLTLFGKEGASAIWSWKHIDYFDYCMDHREVEAARKVLRGEDAGSTASEREDCLLQGIYAAMRNVYDDYRSVDAAELEPSERAQAREWVGDMRSFWEEELGLSASEREEIYQKSVEREGGYINHMDLEKALSPWMAGWLKEEE